MRALSVDQLKPGYALAVSLVDEKGQVLLQRGVQLTEPYIQALKEKGFTRLYIKDETGVDIEPDEDLPPIVRWKAVRSLQETYSRIESEVKSLKGAAEGDVREALNSDTVRQLMGPKGVLPGLEKTVSSMLEELLNHTTLAGLTSIKNASTGKYEHAIDVCVISLMLGQAIGLDSRQMKQLGIGAMLHDIGMIFLKDDLGERARIIQHTQLGFELLRQVESPEVLAPYVAYEHHEHQDGSGLPRGLIGSNSIQRDRSTGKPIPTLIGEIAAIANAYDNCLSGTDEAAPMSPAAAIKFLADHAGTRFNRELVRMFRRIVQIFPRGTQVRLIGEPYDNYIGVVSETSDANVACPRVILALDGNRERIEPKEIDTSKFPELQLRTVGL